MKSKRFTIQQIEDALYEAHGMQTYAAQLLGITYQAIWQRIKKSERLQVVLKETIEKNLDRAELKLMQKINEGEQTSIIFYLKCKGKKRGYIERIEKEVIGEQNINLKVIPDDTVIFQDAVNDRFDEKNNKPPLHAGESPNCN